jgi:hypothetical protein
LLISARTMSPGLKSTNLYGPVPTGLMLFGDSRDLAPMYGPNRCLGRIIPTVPTKGSAQNGAAFGNVTRTLCESTFSTLMSR